MEKFNYQYQKLMTDDEILAMIHQSQQANDLIAQLKLSDEEVLNYSEKILFFINENRPCETCSGIKHCPKAEKGLVYCLFRDDYNELMAKYQSCEPYYQYFGKAQNIVYSSYPIEDILDAKTDEFISLLSTQDSQFISMVAALVKQAKTKGCYLTFKKASEHKKFVLILVSVLINTYFCAIIKMSSFLQELKSCFKNKEKYDQLFYKVENAPILIIDHLGEETISAWSRDDVLLSILNYRLDHDLVTIFVSEFELKQLSLLYRLQNDHLKADKLISKIKQLTQYE